MAMMMMVRGAKARNKIAHCVYTIAEYGKIVKRALMIECLRPLFHILIMRHNKGQSVNMSPQNQRSLDTMTPERHPRGAWGDSVVYPVVSRRARGLSLGINLFPDRKVCDYDCPYCEVPTFSNPDARLVEGDIERELRRFFVERWPLYKNEYELKDVSVSGSGEPTLSPFLGEALRSAKRVLDEEIAYGEARSTVPIVLITNSTGFLRPEVANILADFSKEARFRIWAKLDGGTEALHTALSRSALSLSEIVGGILDISRRVPLTIQTMILSDSRSGRILFDAAAYASTIAAIAANGGQVEAIQLYTVARRPAESWVTPLSDEAMADLARRIRAALTLKGRGSDAVRIECYGEHSELAWG